MQEVVRTSSYFGCTAFCSSCLETAPLTEPECRCTSPLWEALCLEISCGPRACGWELPHPMAQVRRRLSKWLTCWQRPRSRALPAKQKPGSHHTRFAPQMLRHCHRHMSSATVHRSYALQSLHRRMSPCVHRLLLSAGQDRQYALLRRLQTVASISPLGGFCPVHARLRSVPV